MMRKLAAIASLILMVLCLSGSTWVNWFFPSSKADNNVTTNSSNTSASVPYVPVSPPKNHAMMNHPQSGDKANVVITAPASAATNYYSAPQKNFAHQHESFSPIYKRILNLPEFHAVENSPGLQVNLLTGQAQQNVEVVGPKYALDCLSPYVKHQMLYFNFAKSQTVGVCHGVTANISMGRLDLVVHRGDEPFIAKNVETPHLDVSVVGNGNTTISGSNIGLRNLLVNGNGLVTINAVSSPSLVINAISNGNINLKGHAVLRDFRYVGNGQLYLTGVTSTPLNMYISGKNHIFMKGNIDLRKLEYNGTGFLKIYWINSRHLNILASGHGGKICLGGNVGLLHAALAYDVHLDARFLQADTAFIETRNTSEADVLPIQTLYSFAQDQSDIYYFNKPEFFTVDMRTSGSVLPMHNIPGAITDFPGNEH